MNRSLLFLSALIPWITLSTPNLPAGLPRPGSVSGLLVDLQGSPLADVEVTLHEQNGQVSLDAVSDGSGAFRFSGIAPARYRLTARKTGFAPSAVEIVVEPEECRKVEIVLVAASQLRIQERVMVVGDPAELQTLPGSAHYLGKRDLLQSQLDFADVHQMLRQVPGVHIQEEEGFGLRPNIGLRGTGSERSSKITVMEDGVLIAPAPYAAPSAYYFPTAGRMEALEVRKGSSQIKYGPQTQGGALNLVSTSIPSRFRMAGSLGGGEFGTGKLQLNAGDSYQNFGWLFETYQLKTDGFKKLDGGGDTGFDLQDYLAKFRVNTSSHARVYQEFEVKLGYTEHNDRETYLGLTDEDFRARPNRRYRGSALDSFTGNHRQYQGRYFIAPSDRLDFTAIVYRNDFRRNWYKVQSVSGKSLNAVFDDPEGASRELGILKGEDSRPGELRIRANNRGYYSQGVQGVLGLHFEPASISNRLEVGVRYHEDEEDRFQHEDSYQMLNGSPRLTSSGAPGSQSNRISSASAWAFFLQDTVELGRLQLTPGVRYESIDFSRTDYARTDPGRQSPSGFRDNQLDVFIPGVGASFTVSPRLTLYGGLHKGFSPPGPGAGDQTQPETAFNYEAGVRILQHPFKLDLTAFYSDYDNLLGADTLASGGSGEGDRFNGGRARAAGLEIQAAYDLGHAMDLSFGVPLQLTYTCTDAEFRSDFESEFEPWGAVHSGDDLPYLPAQQLFLSLGLQEPGWWIRTELGYTGRMRDRAGQGPIPALQGTDSYLVTNLSGEYIVKKLRNDRRRISVYFSLRNLFDNEYMVARRPAGARPGLPRTLMGGIRFTLGN